jgi:OOP family OmpA-OmpF porin
MNPKSTLVVLGVAAAAFALPALAQMSTSNLYAGASIGQAKAKDACEGASSCDDKDTAWRVFLGYQFTPNIAVEAGYADLGKATASGSVFVPGVGTVAADAKFESTAWDLVAVGMLPLASQFSLYGKLGLYYGEVKASGSGTVGGITVPVSDKDTTTDLTFGIGAGWDINRNFGIRAEYQKYKDMGGSNTGKSDIDVLSIGALYRFR